MSKFLTPERPAVLIGFYRGKERERRRVGDRGCREGKEGERKGAGTGREEGKKDRDGDKGRSVFCS